VKLHSCQNSYITFFYYLFSFFNQEVTVAEVVVEEEVEVEVENGRNLHPEAEVGVTRVAVVGETEEDQGGKMLQHSSFF